MNKCVAKARDIRVKLMQKLESDLPHDTVPEESAGKTIIEKETIIEDPDEAEAPENIEEIEVSDTQSLSAVTSRLVSHDVSDVDLPEIPDENENAEAAEAAEAAEENEGAEEGEEVYEEVYEEIEETTEA